MTMPFPPAEESDIQARYSAEHRVFVKILDGLHALLEKLDGKSMAGLDRVQFFVLFQFVKALKTGRALETLFFSGYGEDSEILLRVLVEQAIIVRWVNQKDSNNRARAYALFLSEKQYGRLKLLRERMPSADLSRVPVKRIERDHEKYKLLKDKLKWRNLTRSPEELADSVGMKNSYLFHYYGTDFVHSNPTIEASYVRSAEGATWFNSAPCMPEVGLSPIIAAQHLLFIADVLNDRFKLRGRRVLRELMREATRVPTSDSPVG
jgi:hypothetical protein